MGKFQNPQRKVAVFWLLVALLGILAALYPSFSGMDMMNGGYAIVLLGLLLVLAGVIVAAIYLRRAKVLADLLSGEKVLAHWTYTEEEWDRYTRAQSRTSRSEKITLFFVISGFALLFGVGFLLFAPDKDAGLAVFLTMLGLIAVIGVTAFLSIKLSDLRSRGQRREVYISSDGVYIGRELHTWNVAGATLEEVGFRERPSALLEISYSYPTRYGMDTATVRVPVPRGQEKAARQIADRLNGLRRNVA